MQKHKHEAAPHASAEETEVFNYLYWKSLTKQHLKGIIAERKKYSKKNPKPKL